MKALAIIFALFSSVAMAAANDVWVHITSTAKGAEYEVKAGTINRAVMKDGAVLYYATGKKTEDSKVTVYMWTVPEIDCHARSGELTVRDMTATKLFSVGFAYGAGNVASQVAEVVCDVAGALK